MATVISMCATPFSDSCKYSNVSMRKIVYACIQTQKGTSLNPERAKNNPKSVWVIQKNYNPSWLWESRETIDDARVLCVGEFDRNGGGIVCVGYFDGVRCTDTRPCAKQRCQNVCWQECCGFVCITVIRITKHYLSLTKSIMFWSVFKRYAKII